MFPLHPDLHRKLNEARHAEMVREAENWRLVREARQAHPSWLTRQGCRLLGQLGRALIRSGKRLESSSHPQPARTERLPGRL
jgi:hypothetical protein